MKFAGFLLAAAAIPAAAQSGFEHGHKIGTSVVYLEQAGAIDLNGRGFVIANSTGNVVITMTPTSGVTSPVTNADILNAARRLAPLDTPCVQFEAWAEQQTSDFIESGQTGATSVDRTEGKAVIHRFVRDDYRKIYASYTVTMEKLPQEGTYRLTLGPPTGELPDLVRGKADWKIFSPANYPAPQIMRDEDSLRVELYSNGKTRRVVDYLYAGRQDRMVMHKETPHDSYAEDAELALTLPRFRVNGVANDAVAPAPETIRGPVLWVYAPGHGRYLLSLQPHPDSGFQSAGEATGKSLTFTAADGSVFRIDTAERVAAGSGSYTVHMLQDLAWAPADPPDRARVMTGMALGVER